MSGVITRLFPEYAPLFITSLDTLRTHAGDWFGVLTTLNETSSGWPASNNQALYVPFNLPFPYPINRWFWANGLSGDHVDVGVYSQSGTRIASTGSIAQNGVNTSIQYVTTPTILLPPGSYYMGISHDSTNNLRVATNATALFLRMMGCVQQASAHPLPSSMTPASMTLTGIPLFGFTRTASGF